MANLQQYPQMHYYVVEKLAENPGAFLRSFLDCCGFADTENFEIVKPALLTLMAKYPLREKGGDADESLPGG
jgi:hypothetical protein